jgi:polysaccharide export outer membrane protein
MPALQSFLHMTQLKAMSDRVSSGRRRAFTRAITLTDSVHRYRAPLAKADPALHVVMCCSRRAIRSGDPLDQDMSGQSAAKSRTSDSTRSSKHFDAVESIRYGRNNVKHLDSDRGSISRSVLHPRYICYRSRKLCLCLTAGVGRAALYLSVFLSFSVFSQANGQTIDSLKNQGTTSPRLPPGDSSASAQYVLGAGDVLRLAVADMPEVSETSARIGPDGTLDLPLIGTIHAAGLSLEQLRLELARRLTRYINDPQITLNLATNGSRTIAVLGEVNSPGVQTLDGPRTLLQVISQAGGVKTDAGPRVIVTRNLKNGRFAGFDDREVVSGNSVSVTLSLDDLLAARAATNNLVMEPGDIVSIPKEQLVYVVGDVRRAGGFPMSSHETMSALQAISLAEGSQPNAALRASKILRPLPGSKTPQEIPVDLKSILAGKAPDVLLYANDVLFVPNSAAKSGARRAAEVMLQVATGVAIYR